MNTQRKVLTALVLATMVTPPLASAQDIMPAGNTQIAAYIPPGEIAPVASPAFSQQELEQLLAPVALYPDALLSQLMMAATYPLEVVQAARWSRENPGLQGDEAVRAVESQEWDPSVKSLVAFPQVLTQLDHNLGWTERLGNAFLAQQAQVMQTVQSLRQKAENTGSLASNQQVRVEQQEGDIMVVPADPQSTYVPYYDPAVVYGPIWSPQYQPVYFAPPLGYYPGYYGSSVFWGPAIFLSAGFFFGAFDWHHHYVSVGYNRPYYFHPGYGGRPGWRPPGSYAGIGQWQHDPSHRHGVAYRDAASRQQFAGGQPGSRQQFAGGQPGMGRGDWHGNNAMAGAAPRAPQYNQAAHFSGENRGQVTAPRSAAQPARTIESPRQESPSRAQFRQNTSFNEGGSPVRYAQARTFDAPRFAAPQAHYEAPQAHFAQPSYAVARSSGSSYSAPRMSMASVSSAHYSAPHYSGGGGGHGGGNSGGNHGGGHGGSHR